MSDKTTVVPFVPRRTPDDEAAPFRVDIPLDVDVLLGALRRTRAYVSVTQRLAGELLTLHAGGAVPADIAAKCAELEAVHAQSGRDGLLLDEVIADYEAIAAMAHAASAPGAPTAS